MKLIDRVDIDHSVCYDFLCSMMRLNYNSDFAPDDHRNSEIFNLIDEVQDQITPEIREKLKIFSNLDTCYAMLPVGYIKLWQVKEVPEFLRRMAEVPVEDLLRRFLYAGIGPGQDITPDLVRELMQDQAQAFAFINQHITYSAEEKWQVLQYLTNPEQTKQDLLELYHWHYENVFRHWEGFVEEFLPKHEEDLADRLKKYGDEYLSLLLPFDYKKHKGEARLTLALSAFYEKSSMINMMEDVYVFGYRYHEKIEGSHSVLAATQVFKALADETRLNIIKILAEGPQYGHQLAQQLNVSNSTVSHHVSTLVFTGLLSSYRQDNRVYFELDVERLKKTVLESIDKITRQSE